MEPTPPADLSGHARMMRQYLRLNMQRPDIPLF